MQNGDDMKLKRNTITGICGIIAVIFFAVVAETQIKKVPNLIEPGPLLMPFVAMALILLSSVMLIINGLRDKSEEKPYFPEGGIKKITFAYLALVVYGIALTSFGFLPTTPFAMMAFIWMLKGDEKVKWWVNILISITVTAFLYLMFVKGFQIKLPAGLLFG